jgi:hypothetical protein
MELEQLETPIEDTQNEYPDPIPQPQRFVALLPNITGVEISLNGGIEMEEALLLITKAYIKIQRVYENYLRELHI